jgi:hypothetical protein
LKDLNGDGKPDLAVGSSSASSVYVLLNDGMGGFGAATPFAAGMGALAVVAADA